MEIRIRRAAFSDLPAVKEMYAALVARMDREGWSVWDETYPRDFVGKDIEQGQLYLLLEGDRLAGAFALPAHDNEEGDVPWVWLVRLALERIGELARGLGAVYLRLYVAHENEPAIALYRKAGFTQLPGEFGEFLLDGTRLFEYAFEKRL